ncbi:MAG: type IV pilus secretin PilQ [Methylococcaceae bacterium]|nr:type IV pilus secretin PilQ [Methylococcaceae bacterium]
MLFLQFTPLQAEPLKLQSLDFTTLPGDKLQIQLSLSGPAFSPRAFQTDNPARIALDLPGVANGLDKKSIPINIGGAESIQAIEASGRTRVVLNLTESTPYSTKVEGNDIFLTLQKGKGGRLLETSDSMLPEPTKAPPQSVSTDGLSELRNLDFRRGDKGVGRILITLSNPKTIVNIREEGRKVIATFAHTALPPTLARRLDVMDFATPVQFIDASDEGNQAKLVISPATDEFDYSSYQTDNQLTIEFRPLSKVEKEEIKKKAFAYSGEKLSLNFQDIPVRSVLQILGDFTNLNIVASDTVQGSVTLRLNDVPWDQALDLVLKAKNLGKRQDGNIIRVLPLDELNKQEKEELESQKVVEELEPLKTEIIQVNYTKAEDVKTVLVGTTEKTSQTATQPEIGGGSSKISTTSLDVSQSILSGRGNVTVDQRTNQLIVKDTARNLAKIRELVRQLDIPVRQVLIESRVVIANNDFTRELGSRLAVNHNGYASGTTRKLIATDPAGNDLTKQTFKGDTFASPDMLVDLGSAAAAATGGSAGFTLLKAGNYLLDLELSAAQTEGRGEVVSNPRLITSDQTKAVIKQGNELPYQATASIGGAGVATISYKQVVLELTVTPHITPDDNILMELLIKKDEKGEPTTYGLAIDKREISTTVQVANGETVVLGGVYEGKKTNTTDKVPFFGDLPGVGFMFRRNKAVDQKKELLIFITPKILKQNLGGR